MVSFRDLRLSFKMLEMLATFAGLLIIRCGRVVKYKKENEFICIIMVLYYLLPVVLVDVIAKKPD